LQLAPLQLELPRTAPADPQRSEGSAAGGTPGSGRVVCVQRVDLFSPDGGRSCDGCAVALVVAFGAQCTRRARGVSLLMVFLWLSGWTLARLVWPVVALSQVVFTVIFGRALLRWQYARRLWLTCESCSLLVLPVPIFAGCVAGMRCLLLVNPCCRFSHRLV
jgi:hypothetical protein